MKLTKEDIEKMEIAGNCNGTEVYHILTKGGFNLIVKKMDGGEIRVLGKGPHRSIARHMAESADKSIQWNESLFKTEEILMKAPKEIAPEHVVQTPEPAQQKDALGEPMYDSSPQNHYDLASHFSKMTGKFQNLESQSQGNMDKLQKEHGHNRTPEFQNLESQLSGHLHHARMMQLFNADKALKHYQMSGMDPKQSMDEHKKMMNMHHEVQENHEPPFSEYALSLAWNRANPGKRPPKGFV